MTLRGRDRTGEPADGPPGALDRRQLNLAILSTALSGLLPTAASSRLPKPLFDFAIAGGWHHGLGAAIGELLPGERLLLRPEPDNVHDRFAVAIDRRSVMLGYMPREASEAVSGLLASGRKLAVEMVGPPHPRPDQADIADLVCTSFSEGDPRLRLLDEG